MGKPFIGIKELLEMFAIWKIKFMNFYLTLCNSEVLFSYLNFNFIGKS